jgi:hypothetical protein
MKKILVVERAASPMRAPRVTATLPTVAIARSPGESPCIALGLQTEESQIFFSPFFFFYLQ